jgi:DNA repair exonuclease SbcCD ATPase subunit
MHTKRTAFFVFVSVLAVPLFAGAQQGIEPMRPVPAAMPVPAANAIERPWQQVLRPGAPVNLEAVRNAKQQALEAVETQRERFKNANPLELPVVASDVAQTRRELIQLMNERQQEVLNRLREKQTQQQAEGSVRRLEILQGYLTRFGEVLEGRIERLVSIADRLDERIARLEGERGVDLSEASALLDDAYVLLRDASEKAEDFSATVLEAAEVETAATAAARLKELRAEVQEAIRLAHAKLVEAIAAVRAGLAAQPLPSALPEDLDPVINQQQ